MNQPTTVDELAARLAAFRRRYRGPGMGVAVLTGEVRDAGRRANRSRTAALPH